MATTTTHFGFNIAEGTDVVNLLTQCYPNFTDLDGYLYAIKNTGVTQGTHTKVGTVHQIVLTDSDCTMFKFVATGNYASGDTFTVDGNAVTATAMDGTSLPAGAFVINQSVVGILNGLVLTIVGVPGVSSIDAEDVVYDNTGSGLTATDAQAAIDEVVSDLQGLDANVSTYVSGTILAGNTTITLSSAAIETTSFIDIYFKDKVLAPTDVTVVTGAVTIQITAEASDTEVAVRIANL